VTTTRRALLLLACLPLALAFRCGGLRSIAVDFPGIDTLHDEPINASARVGTNFVVASVEVRVDGVDLVAALGLVAPFSGASGVVLIGSDPVLVSDFSFTATNPRRIDFVLTGLPSGDHVFEVEGMRNDGPLVADANAFQVVGGFSLALDALPAAGLPGGPRDAGSEGVLVNASLGQPFAAAPVGLADGGQLRAGFVEAAEAAIAGAQP